MSATTMLTFADFEKLPDAPGKQELLDGELIQLPPAERNHSATARKYLHLLARIVGEDRVEMEAGYRIAEGWLQPDVSIPWPEQTTESGYLVNAPMLAI